MTTRANETRAEDAGMTGLGGLYSGVAFGRGDANRVRDRLRARRATAAEAGYTPEPVAALSADLCRRCLGVGWVQRAVPAEHPDFGRLAPCQCAAAPPPPGVAAATAAADASLAALRANFVPAPWRDARLDDDEAAPPAESDAEATTDERALALAGGYAVWQEEAWHAAAEYARGEPSGWLALRGPGGAAGERLVRLAAGIVNDRIDRGRPARLLTPQDLDDRYRDTEPADFFRWAREVRAEPLVAVSLSGVSAGIYAPAVTEFIAGILAFRYTNRLPTVVAAAVDERRLPAELRNWLTGVDPSFCRQVTAAASSGEDGRPMPRMAAMMSFPTYDPTYDGACGRRAAAHNAESARFLYLWARREMIYGEGIVVIIGECGRGKTHLAVATLQERARGGGDIYYATVPDLLDRLRGGAELNAAATSATRASRVEYDAGAALLERVKYVDCLVLDDLGSERRTPFAEERLWQIINHRHENNMSTVITVTDLNLIKDSRPQIYSRLRHRSAVTTILLAGPDYRLESADDLPSDFDNRVPDRTP